MAEDEFKRRRVLLITRNLPPLRGGMERLVHRIARSLAHSCQLSVVGPKGCAEFLPKEVCSQEVTYRSLTAFLWASAKAVWSFTRLNDVDLVIAGSGLTAPLAWWAARRKRARFAVYLHGLDIVTTSAIYQFCWLPFIRRADLILVNSTNTRRLAIGHGICDQAIEILHPGTNFPGPDASAARAFRLSHGLADRPVLLSVGRFTPRKGLAEFIRRAMPEILSRHPEALLMIIGADAVDSARHTAGSEHKRILRAATEAGVANAIRVLPPCDDATLSAAYRAADVHIFPVLELPGDVEGFGMVAIEAAAHGLPTVAFSVGGVPDAVIEGRSGTLASPGDYVDLALQVHQWLARTDVVQVRERCIKAAQAFGWDRFDRRLQHALNVLVRE